MPASDPERCTRSLSFSIFFLFFFFFQRNSSIGIVSWARTYALRTNFDAAVSAWASQVRSKFFLEGRAASSSSTRLSKNRSVMPLDVLGRTRATLKGSACSPFPRGTGNPLNPLRGRDRSLQLFSVNQEFPVSASHKLALITSLPFVHTARRYYRLNVLVRYLD